MQGSSKKLRNRFMTDAEHRKYAFYAIGELALLIVGVLIALQVDNWNNDRLDRKTLGKYLQAIARNIGSDLEAVNELRLERERSYELGNRWLSFENRSGSFTRPEIAFSGDVLEEARILRHFNARISGYEALKTSGTMDLIQGTDLEKLLYDYYDTVARIESREQDYNQLTRLKLIEYYAAWPQGLQDWELYQPVALTDTRFEALQPKYRALFESFMTLELVESMRRDVGSLIYEYDTLNRIGSIIIELVDGDEMQLDDSTAAVVDDLRKPRARIGYADLMTNGRIAWHSYFFINSDADDPSVSYTAPTSGAANPWRFDSFLQSDDHWNVNYYGGVPWAGFWFIAGPRVFNFESVDFSGYGSLLLELRGEDGGEKIFINMEDIDDPKDGSSTKVELELSDQWQTYEVDLARFETADLERLSAAVGFVFFEEPVSFSIRTIKFVRKDQ